MLYLILTVVDGENNVYNGYKVLPAALQGDLDFDNDGVIDSEDDDDDNDGIPDAEDKDDDNDGIPDNEDDDDDNDGIPDHLDQDVESDGDLDNDGVADDIDDDDDNDGIPDALDNDDDNDGIPDALDDEGGEDDGAPPPLDTDGDQIPDEDDPDIDNDGILNVNDDDDDGDGLSDEEDTKGTSSLLKNNYVTVFVKLLTSLIFIKRVLVCFILHKSITYRQSNSVFFKCVFPTHFLCLHCQRKKLISISVAAGGIREFSWGFGYGCTWCCLIFIFISVVLLICDRESEEIFYKERPVEEEGEEEEA